MKHFFNDEYSIYTRIKEVRKIINLLIKNKNVSNEDFNVFAWNYKWNNIFSIRLENKNLVSKYKPSV